MPARTFVEHLDEKYLVNEISLAIRDLIRGEHFEAEKPELGGGILHTVVRAEMHEQSCAVFGIGVNGTLDQITPGKSNETRLTCGYLHPRSHLQLRSVPLGSFSPHSPAINNWFVHPGRWERICMESLNSYEHGSESAIKSSKKEKRSGEPLRLLGRATVVLARKATYLVRCLSR